MQFDTTIMPLQLSLAVSEDDGHLEVVIVSGTMIPLGPNQMAPLPIGVYRLPIPNKKAAVQFQDQLSQAIESMPEDAPQSNLIVANNIRQADDFAANINQFK